LLAAVLPPVSHADIYKCTDEHGNAAYQSLPCPAEVAKSKESDNTPPSTVDDVPQDPIEDDELTESEVSTTRPPSSRQPGESSEDCKKRYRDQIDLIDVEMRSGFSAEEGEQYKENLLALTFQLRACDDFSPTSLESAS
jgi:hypothetical protein